MFPHDAAGGMLNFLDVRFHHQRAWHNDRARQRHKACPAADDADANNQHTKSDPEFAFKSPHQSPGQRWFGPVQCERRRPTDQECTACAQALPREMRPDKLLPHHKS